MLANDVKEYDALIVVTPKDYLRLEKHYDKLLRWLPVRKLKFIGSDQVGQYLEMSKLGARVEFINENDILSFDVVHEAMANALKDMVNGELPRGITGWYYQQFLKMQYAFICEDEYYMVWDGDTIPCGPFSMFKEGTEEPYLDLKTEFHEPYFRTISKLLPGMQKCIQKSFIAEHMLIKRDIMKSLMSDIESNAHIPGKKFWEKIIAAIEPAELLSNSFSEFETFGTYVAFRYPMAYRLRPWHSFRYGGEFFELDEISEDDLKWLKHDFFAISFEKAHFVREDHKNLFTNKEYQHKLTARQMLEIAQQEFGEGSYQEIWDE